MNPHYGRPDTARSVVSAPRGGGARRWNPAARWRHADPDASSAAHVGSCRDLWRDNPDTVGDNERKLRPRHAPRSRYPERADLPATKPRSRGHTHARTHTHTHMYTHTHTYTYTYRHGSRTTVLSGSRTSFLSGVRYGRSLARNVSSYLLEKTTQSWICEHINKQLVHDL